MEKTTKLPTAKELEEQFGENVSNANCFMDKFNFSYPEKPSKPRLEQKHNSKDIEIYQKAYEQYEIDLVEYGKQKTLYIERNCDINNTIESYIKEISGFNRLSETTKKKVWYKAWEDGHSSGYYQVYYELCDLVDLFN